MTLDVAMYHIAHERVADRLAALELPVRVLPLHEDGTCRVDGEDLPLGEVAPEAVWLSLEVATSGMFDACIEAVAASSTVKWLQTFNAGLDHPGYRAIAAAGIRIGASNAQAVAIAEYTFAQVLNLYQPIEAQREAQARREWKQLGFRELSRSTWVIVGYGNIGQEVGARAKAFGARVLAVRRRATPSAHADALGTQADLPAYLAEGDVVVLCCPHTAETDRLVDRDFLAAMKRDAILVNVARGGVIDDEALLAALDEGKLQAAVLDVFDPEPLPRNSRYWDHPRVRLTAHSSFAGEATAERGDALFLANLARYLAGEPLINEVDLALYLDTLR